MSFEERLKNLEFAARKVDSLLDGREVLDSVPLNANLNLNKPESITAMIKRLVKTHVSVLQESEGYESFEEAMDFDTGEDAELKTAYDIDEYLDSGYDNHDKESTSKDTDDSSGDTVNDSTDVEEVKDES
jgi:hypothetical protein